MSFSPFTFIMTSQISSFTKFNLLNKSRNSIKIPSCYPRSVVETRQQDCKNQRTKKIFL